MCFFLKILDFSELCQFCCSGGVLPAWCVYTHKHQGKTEKDQGPKYSKIFGKKHNIYWTSCIWMCTLFWKKCLIIKIKTMINHVLKGQSYYFNRRSLAHSKVIWISSFHDDLVTQDCLRSVLKGQSYYFDRRSLAHSK